MNFFTQYIHAGEVFWAAGILAALGMFQSNFGVVLNFIEKLN